MRFLVASAGQLANVGVPSPNAENRAEKTEQKGPAPNITVWRKPYQSTSIP
jgi:hypothetical protein